MDMTRIIKENPIKNSDYMTSDEEILDVYDDESLIFTKDDSNDFEEYEKAMDALKKESIEVVNFLIGPLLKAYGNMAYISIKRNIHALSKNISNANDDDELANTIWDFLKTVKQEVEQINK